MIRGRVAGFLVGLVVLGALGLSGCAEGPSDEELYASVVAEACEEIDIALQKVNRAMEPMMTATSMKSLKGTMQTTVPNVAELAAVEAPESVATPRDALVVALRKNYAAVMVTETGEGLEASLGALAGPSVDLIEACD